jgi:hypothetical protein
MIQVAVGPKLPVWGPTKCVEALRVISDLCSGSGEADSLADGLNALGATVALELLLTMGLAVGAENAGFEPTKAGQLWLIWSRLRSSARPPLEMRSSGRRLALDTGLRFVCSRIDSIIKTE